MIQQRSIAILDFAELTHEIGYLLHVIRVDSSDLCQSFRVVVVVGNRMMRIGDAGFRITPPAPFGRDGPFAGCCIATLVIP